MKLSKIIVILALSMGLGACTKKKFSDIPKLTFNNFSTNNVKAGSNEKLYIYIGIQDGDGDIGFGTNNLFFKDLRDSSTTNFQIPVISEQYNPKDGIEGILGVEYNASFLLLRPDSLHKENDTIVWEIYIKDKKGNKSNTVTTTPLYLFK